jgi:head-tail adaptor
VSFGLSVTRRTPTLPSGRLRHRIQLVRTKTAQDSTGGFDLDQCTLFATVWASMEALTGLEQFATESQVSRTTYQCIMRYIGAAPSWIESQAYLAGALIKDSNGNLQQAVADGVSGATVPTWATSTGSFTHDGDPSLGLSWKCLGVAPVRTAITAALQIVWQGRKFQITSVQNPDGRSKMLSLLCDEINDSTQQDPQVTTAIGA